TLAGGAALFGLILAGLLALLAGLGLAGGALRPLLGRMGLLGRPGLAALVRGGAALATLAGRAHAGPAGLRLRGGRRILGLRPVLLVLGDGHRGDQQRRGRRGD